MFNSFDNLLPAADALLAAVEEERLAGILGVRVEIRNDQGWTPAMLDALDAYEKAFDETIDNFKKAQV